MLYIKVHNVYSQKCVKDHLRAKTTKKTCLQKTSILSPIRTFSVTLYLLTETTGNQRPHVAVLMGGLYRQV